MRRVSGEGKATLADALVRMADATRAAEPGESAETRTTGADRAAVVVHLAPDALDEGHQATLDDGTRVSAETFRRVACDCALLAVQKGARGEVLDVGRKTRSIPPALRRAVLLRDAHCRFPGCTHDRFIDLHHVEHWLHGGETKLSNLVALCTHHHRLLHEGGFTMELDEPRGREARFFAPGGAEIPRAHVPAEAPAEPGRAFAERHGALGVAIDEDTGMTWWDGRAPDYRACVGAAAGVGW